MDFQEHHGSGDTRRRDPVRWFDDGIDVDASSYSLIISVFGVCLIPLRSRVPGRGRGPLFWTDGSVIDSPDSRDP